MRKMPKMKDGLSSEESIFNHWNGWSMRDVSGLGCFEVVCGGGGGGGCGWWWRWVVVVVGGER